MKIFKFNFDKINCAANLPKGAIILRTDSVFDDQNQGDYIWAIVDPRETEFELRIVPFPWSRRPEPNLSQLKKHRLAVKEKQELWAVGKPVYAKEGDGEIFVYCDDQGSAPIVSKIAVYKTGQEIDIPIERLEYLGLNRLWIIQELGLYTFLINP